MGQSIVICSDGTGSTFDGRATNLTTLVRCLDLTRPDRQVVVYDQGVGTTAARTDLIERYRQTLDQPSALRVLAAPAAARMRPKPWLDRARGLLFGYGLQQNVGQMYAELTRLYDGPDDRVFLFGFSRGAFTVRALAGLLFRCQLPPRDCADIDGRFEQAWQLYQPIHPDDGAVHALLADQRPCPVHFLGLWDTVKSYGGLDPVMLPHLRHNPVVGHVRHALALDERRAWFAPTSWGLLDSDRNGAMQRLAPEDRAAYEQQDIEEVWFAGCHADIGGGPQQASTARIAFRWMLGEAVNVSPGLRLNDAGHQLLATPDPVGPPEVHESWGPSWRLAEQLPRKEIDNSGRYPVKKRARGSTGRRVPDRYRRAGLVAVHSTAAGSRQLPASGVSIRTTAPLGDD